MVAVIPAGGTLMPGWIAGPKRKSVYGKHTSMGYLRPGARKLGHFFLITSFMRCLLIYMFGGVRIQV